MKKATVFLIAALFSLSLIPVYANSPQNIHISSGNHINMHIYTHCPQSVSAGYTEIDFDISQCGSTAEFTIQDADRKDIICKVSYTTNNEAYPNNINVSITYPSISGGKRVDCAYSLSVVDGHNDGNPMPLVTVAEK